MIEQGRIAQRAEFIGAAAGCRFRLITEPADRPPRGAVLWVHAFADEMNKTRRMSARMARLLAGAGWRVIQKDLHGCGDSSGDFREASWASWLDDLRDELSALDPTQPLWLWSVRGGALLAGALLESRPAANVLLWQPATNGAQHLQQFLRLHAGARIVGSTKASGEANPAQTLRAGSVVEVGGYELAPALAAGMEQASFDIPPGHAGRIVWFDISPDEAALPSPHAIRSVERLRQRGLRVDLETLSGPPFWQTQEMEDCDSLLQRSLAWVQPTEGAEAPPSQ